MVKAGSTYVGEEAGALGDGGSGGRRGSGGSSSWRSGSGGHGGGGSRALLLHGSSRTSSRAGSRTSTRALTRHYEGWCVGGVRKRRWIGILREG